MKQRDARNNSIQQNHRSQPPSWRLVLAAIEAAWPSTRWRDLGVVVGCSGGGDSVALLKGLADLARSTDHRSPPSGFLIAAHFNHRRRGQQADQDERFVQQLAEQLDVHFIRGRSEQSASDEASMRDQRHHFLRETAHRCGARYIALAHSADDQVETVLYRLMRGTGPSGLAGIAPHRPIDHSELVLSRPLLSVSRDALRAGLAAIGQAWREDPSNRQTDFRRNWIRHEIIPAICQQYPDAPEAICRAADTLRQWREVMESLAGQWLEKNLRRSQAAVPTVTICRDGQTAAAILVVAMQQLWNIQRWPQAAMTQSHWSRLAETIRSTEETGFSLPGSIEVTASDSRVKLTAPQPPRDDFGDRITSTDEAPQGGDHKCS